MNYSRIFSAILLVSSSFAVHASHTPSVPQQLNLIIEDVIALNSLALEPLKARFHNILGSSTKHREQIGRAIMNIPQKHLPNVTLQQKKSFRETLDKLKEIAAQKDFDPQYEMRTKHTLEYLDTLNEKLNGGVDTQTNANQQPRISIKDTLPPAPTQSQTQITPQNTSPRPPSVRTEDLSAQPQVKASIQVGTQGTALPPSNNGISSDLGNKNNQNKSTSIQKQASPAIDRTTPANDTNRSKQSIPEHHHLEKTSLTPGGPGSKTGTDTNKQQEPEKQEETPDATHYAGFFKSYVLNKKTLFFAAIGAATYWYYTTYFQAEESAKPVVVAQPASYNE